MKIIKKFNIALINSIRDDLLEVKLVYIRFIGYQQGDSILYQAKITSTLPGGYNQSYNIYFILCGGMTKLKGHQLQMNLYLISDTIPYFNKCGRR